MHLNILMLSNHLDLKELSFIRLTRFISYCAERNIYSYLIYRHARADISKDFAVALDLETTFFNSTFKNFCIDILLINLRLTPRSHDVSSALVFAVILPASSIFAPLITNFRFLPSLTICILEMKLQNCNVRN